MKFAASLPFTVPFHDVDAMGVVWHGHYFKYCELARTQLARELDLDWPAVKELGWVMPVIGFEVKYRQPLRYGQNLRLHAQIDEPLLPAMIVRYDITDAESGVTHAAATSRQAYVPVTAGTELSGPASLTIPAAIERRLQETWGRQ